MQHTEIYYTRVVHWNVVILRVDSDTSWQYPYMCYFHIDYVSGLILGLRSANERRRYKVTPSLIGWAQT